LAQRERPQLARQYVLRQEEDRGEGAAPAYATIIAEQPTEIRQLSVGEAVMRMDLADQPLLVFRNSGSGELNVVYRRSDGHIGWIDPSQPAPAADQADR
ncbi:MAG: sigma 54 modulation/S30EA ribosomal C-terminal domain-containing protein, partial [Acetobacteraceae bacterium]|nr:sigma 54 modulation/S30EA ribosomal C-terminal domain-containing protein [Acetobacteraceae bacterium]